jgi:hypothetical protein
MQTCLMSLALCPCSCSTIMNQHNSGRLRTALDTEFFIYEFKTELCSSVSKTSHITAS